jgi:protein O-GlcNAc transferase
MKNVISFSLWGDNPLYTHGAIHNIKLANKFYPEWVCRFYIDAETVPQHIIQEILHSGSEVEFRYNNRDTLGSMWRFEVMFDRDVDRFMIRDADSRIYYREVVAVEEWLDSGKDFHLMRDHKDLNISMCAGMFGGKVSSCLDLEVAYNYEINNPRLNCIKGVDQEFLNNYFWDTVKQNMLCHDSHKNYNGCNGTEYAFTIPLEGEHHVGYIERDYNNTGESAYREYWD